MEFPCFEVILRRHNLQFAQEVSRPKLLYHRVGGGFKAESRPRRMVCKCLSFFWMKCDLHRSLLYSGEGDKVHHGRKVLYNFVVQYLSSMSTARFPFSSLEKYIMSIYICVSRTVEGGGKSWRMLALGESRACSTSACLSLSYVFKERRKRNQKKSQSPTQTIIYFSFIFLIFMFLQAFKKWNY